MNTSQKREAVRNVPPERAGTNTPNMWVRIRPAFGGALTWLRCHPVAARTIALVASVIVLVVEAFAFGKHVPLFDWQSAKAWAFGLTFSLIFGGAVTSSFHRAVLALSRLPVRSPNGRVPPWLTGATERLFFTVVTGLVVGRGGSAFGAIPAVMVAWLVLKLATHWNRPSGRHENDKKKAGAIAALIAGLISMLFALLGGMVCAGMWAPFPY